MIPTILSIHDPRFIVLPLKHSFPSLPIMHLPSSTSLLSVFNPFTSLKVPFGQFFYSVCTSSAFSISAFEIAFFDLFFMLLYLLLFSSVLFFHITLCASFFLENAFNHLFIPPPSISFASPPPLLTTHLTTCL